MELFLCKVNKYKEADEVFKTALKYLDYFNTAEVYENAGLCSLDSADEKKAEQYFLKYVLYDRNRTNSWLEYNRYNV